MRNRIKLWQSAFAVVLLVGSAGAVANSFDEADDVTEECLSAGKLLKRQKTLDGVTRPELYLIECDGAQRRVLVKRYDKEVRGITRFGDGTWEMNFSDSYRYERAAYLLDRQIGLNMVPVAVVRKVGRNNAGIIEWIENASEIRTSPHTPTGTERAKLAQQKAVMDLFDALIFNTDRNLGNYLVDDEDWNLYLIDHSRAFRAVNDLPDGFSEGLIRLPRDVYDRLKELNQASLDSMMGDLLSPAQIGAILERRDKILQKIDTDRKNLGDDVVFVN